MRWKKKILKQASMKVAGKRRISRGWCLRIDNQRQESYSDRESINTRLTLQALRLSPNEVPVSTISRSCPLREQVNRITMLNGLSGKLRPTYVAADRSIEIGVRSLAILV